MFVVEIPKPMFIIFLFFIFFMKADMIFNIRSIFFCKKLIFSSMLSIDVKKLSSLPFKQKCYIIGYIRGGDESIY